MKNRRNVPTFATIGALADTVTFKNLALVAFATGVAFFVLAPRMGFYEDDFFYIAQPAGWSIRRFIFHIYWAITTLPEGRPIGWLLPQTISFFGWRLGGLPALYFAAFLVTVLNASLFYFLLKRFAGETFALFGTFGLVLFPADTTRPFLMHAFGLQTSLTFCLIASLVYFSTRRAWSYLLAAACLLTYESAFLPFLFIPLLELPWDRARVGTLVRHLALCALLVAADLIFRRAFGEGRVVTTFTDPLSVVFQSVAGMAIGPIVSLSTFGYRFLAPLSSPSRVVWAGTLIVAVVLVWRLGGVANWFGVRAHGRSSAEREHENSERGIGTLPPIQYLFLAGLMLIGAYAFAFTHFPPTITNGRFTSVHLAAAVGAGILFGWLCTAFLYFAGRARLEWAAGTVLGLYLAGLVGFGLVIQTDFVSAWRQERLLWTQIVERAGDADPETVILVEDLLERPSSFINPFAPWTVLGTFGMLYGPDRGSTAVSWVFFTDENWTEYLKENGDRILMDHPELGALGEIQTELHTEKFIRLRYQEGELVRIDEALELNGKVYAPKPRTEDVLMLRSRRPLFDVLIDPTLE